MGTQLPHDYPPPDLEERSEWSESLVESVRENLFAVGVIGIVFILGVLSVYQFGLFGPSSEELELQELELLAERARNARAEEPAARPRINVSVFSEPEGALVYVNSDPVGLTPLINQPVPAGVVSLSLRKFEYAPRDTLVVVAEERPRSFFFELTGEDQPFLAEGGEPLPEGTGPAPGSESGRGTETARNSPAEDREPVPPRPTLPTATPRTETAAPAGERDERAEALARVLQPRSTVQIIVRPWGTIYIDGVVHVRDTDVMYTASLAPGTHHLSAVHPSLGSLNRTIDVESGVTETIVLDFNQTHSLTVTSTPTFGEIFVNGRSTGFYTPQRLTLPVGEHRIEVRREGFRSSAPQTVRIERDVAEPLSFELTEESS